MTEEQLKHLQELVDKTTKRGPSFAMMINHVGQIQNPLIVETGCARQENNFEGDGMSTTIFDTFVDYHGGDFYSVDINPDNVKFASSKTKKANIFCGDSVSYLYYQSQAWQAQNRKIDLLYLDSYDFDMKNPHPSSLHHIFELTAIMPCLKPGTMICVDDNFGTLGKGCYVKEFMDSINKDRLYDGYQWVWKL